MSDNHSKPHGYYTGDIHNQFVEEHYDPKNRSVIWRTFWILLFITIFEVAIAYPIIKAFGLAGVLIGLLATQLITIFIYWYHLRKEMLGPTK
jgi:hypothetical protein